ncbi:hypothetical protein CoNPh26_CDS0090 [Staphylococcus phage S-CoN_Ph26]|nr:hypothetical protein CoNPh26_CDS0090 [Staphylococcus phage S-CoN_Ph26]
MATTLVIKFFYRTTTNFWIKFLLNQKQLSSKQFYWYK